MIFLRKAKIGYHCWRCGQDTRDFVSETPEELCHNCDKKYQSDLPSRVQERLYENELFIEDSEDDLIPSADLKIKLRGWKGLLSFIDWLNANVGKGKWGLPINPVKEMMNNGSTTTHFQLFVPYNTVNLEYKTLWYPLVELVGFRHMPKDGNDYRWKVEESKTINQPKPVQRHESYWKQMDEIDEEFIW